MNLDQLPGETLISLAPFLALGDAALLGQQLPRDCADLEISLHRRQGEAYSLETRFTPPGSQVEARLGADKPVEIRLDDPLLTHAEVQVDWEAYSRALSSAFFAPEAVRMAFGQALARAGTAPLRLRLLLGPTAQELHRLPWETLRNPLDGALLAVDQNILFSRYLAGDGSREVHLRPKTTARALVAVANPAGLEAYDLTPVDVAGETARTRESLRGMSVTNLPSADQGCTLAALVGRLQEGYDILYLVAHGSMARGEAWLWLEDEDRAVRRVSGAELAGQVRLLDAPPLLVVLASCESAGKGEGDALQALGPLLAEAGVPAVIAMQGQISMHSVARAMPVFFENLLRHGVVDRALAAARASLAAAGAHDLWMPALFMRLKDGALWKRPTEVAPAHVQRLWGAIQARFAGRPAAEGALQELLADPDDPDNQDVFRLQLKKSLRGDSEFAGELTAILKAGKASGGDESGGVVINVGGNVGGSIVLGDNNVIGDRGEGE